MHHMKQQRKKIGLADLIINSWSC